MTENDIYPFISSFFDITTGNHHNHNNNNINNNNVIIKTEYHGGSRGHNIGTVNTLTGGQVYAPMDNLRENPMLTTAISIPQRSGGHHQPRVMADFSEFGLDALDASSLSPHMLQDISLTGMTGINGQLNSNLNAMNTMNSGDNLSISGGVQNTTGNANTMWSDIGNAMIATKTEPFQIDDDYIFQIDKVDPTLAELNDETLLEDLNMEDWINDQGSYLTSISPQTNLQQMQSPNHINTSMEASISPQHQLLQQHQQNQQHSPQQSQQHHNHQQQSQRQQHILSPQIRSSAQEVLYDEQNTTGSSSPYEIYHSTPTKSFNSSAAFSPASHASSNSPLLINSVTPPPHTNRSQYQQNMASHSGKTRSPALHELLKKEYSMSPDRSVLGQSVPGPSTSHVLISGNALSPASSGFGSTGRKIVGFSSSSIGGTSRLSSSAPTHLGLDQIWQRREPRQHLLSTGSLAEAESFSSISTGSVLSPEANDFSHDEGYSDYDSDHYEDCSSDNGSDNEDETRGNPATKGGKERYFWQYNVQAKGPKGQRLVIKTQQEDPHVLNEVTDPVFSPNCSVRGIKHSGKARKGDGNDLTPNPRKLNNIGKELEKLGRTINDMTPVSELPFNVRPKSRKEKNKLASRACRLKKKAQHEANKIKLYGLEVEHKKLLTGINDIKRILAIKYQNQNENTEEANQQIEKICKASTSKFQPKKIKIAGTTTEFVNKVLEKVKAGVPNGGLEDMKSI